MKSASVNSIPVSEPPTTGPIRRNTGFLGDVTRLVSGTIASQMLGVLATPLLARMYAPEAFGTAALFVSVTGILGVIACMRYELAIMLPEDDREAANLLGVSLVSTLFISVLTIVPIWFGRNAIARWLNSPELSLYLLLLPVAILISGCFLALNYWNSRTKHFGRLSISRVLNQATTYSTMLFAGYAGYATGGAQIITNLTGNLVATIVLGIQILRDDWRFLVHSIRWREMYQGAKHQRKFPLYSTWSALLNTASWQLPAFLLGMFFSATEVGYYALGFRILQMPMSLIGRSIAQVFFQRAAEAKGGSNLASLVHGLFYQLVTIGIFPIFTLTIIGKDLYILVFGPDWAEAGIYTQILSVWAFFWFISSPLSTLFSLLERQELDLKFNTVIFISRFASLAVGGYLADPRLAVFLFSVTGIGAYGYLNLAIMRYSGVDLGVALKSLGKGFLVYLPFGVSVLFFHVMKIDIVLLIIIIAFMSAVYYFILFYPYLRAPLVRFRKTPVL